MMESRFGASGSVEVGYPEPVRAAGREVAPHPVRRSLRSLIDDGGPLDLPLRGVVAPGLEDHPDRSLTNFLGILA